MAVNEKPLTPLHKMAISEVAIRLGRPDLAQSAQEAKSVFDGEAIAFKLEAELWRQRHARFLIICQPKRWADVFPYQGLFHKWNKNDFLRQVRA